MTDSDGITNDNAGSNIDDKTKDVVSYETHARLLKQRKADQDAMRLMEAKLAEITQKQKEVEETELKKQGQFKELLTLREKELEAERNRVADLKREKELREKLYAFESHLPGRIKRPEFLAFVDADSIKINPETNQIDEGSLESCVQGFVSKYADLIETKSGQRMPSDAPKNFLAGKITYDEWLRLPLKDKKTKWNDVIQ